jgi:mono/diheme cytochrome c family protein
LFTRSKAFVLLSVLVAAIDFCSVAQAFRPADEAIDRGKATFLRVGCYQCHGREAQGASTGPRLGPTPIPLAAFARAVRTPRNEMPPYSVKLLSDAELADVYAFVSSRPQPVRVSNP